MTLLGTDAWDVQLVDGPRYTVESRCSNPGCRSWAEHAHHIVRRSHVGGGRHRDDERPWVKIREQVYPNLCGLCPPCHNLVTGGPGGHPAAIFLVDGTWVWSVADSAGELRNFKGTERFTAIGPLDPHPPTLEGAEHASTHEVPGAGVCPTCGQARKRRVGGGAPARRRKSWVVRVPDDEQEKGAEVLDTLVDDLALVLGYEPGPSARYFVIVPALVSAQLNRSRFVNEVKGVGG